MRTTKTTKRPDGWLIEQTDYLPATPRQKRCVIVGQKYFISCGMMKYLGINYDADPDEKQPNGFSRAECVVSGMHYKYICFGRVIGGNKITRRRDRGASLPMRKRKRVEVHAMKPGNLLVDKAGEVWRVYETPLDDEPVTAHHLDPETAEYGPPKPVPAGEYFKLEWDEYEKLFPAVGDE